jgi:hypothetical protein
MLQLLASLGTRALAEIVKKMVTGALKWAENREEPMPELVELKLGTIAKKNLPDSIPPNKREAVVTSLVDLVMPTFEQIVEYSPNTRQVITAAKRASAKKAIKKAAKKIAYKGFGGRKTPSKKSVAKKVAGRKTPAKKAPLRGFRP